MWAEDIIRKELVEYIFTSEEGDAPKRARPYTFIRDNRLCRSQEYVDDFGYQWNELAEEYLSFTSLHWQQFGRLGIDIATINGATVLDAGAGSGRFSDLAVDLGARVVAVDLSASIERYAAINKSHNVSPLRASIQDLPIKSNSFDIIFSWGVIHHTPEPRKAVRELLRVLRPGGKLYVWVYGDTQYMKRRSLYNNYMGQLAVSEMEEYATLLTSMAHRLASDDKAGMADWIGKNMCFSLKGKESQTRMVLFDGLGPQYHHVLKMSWFADLAKELSLDRESTSQFGVSQFKGSGRGFPGLSVVFEKD